MDDPQCQAAQQAVGQGEASKSAGKAGEDSQDVDKPTGVEGGAQTPPNVAQDPTIDPPQAQPSTSKGATQDPTSDRKTVLDCIVDKSGRYLSEDEYAVYVESADTEIKKTQVKVSY